MTVTETLFALLPVDRNEKIRTVREAPWIPLQGLRQDGGFRLPQTDQPLELRIAKWISGARGEIWFIEALNFPTPTERGLYFRCDKVGNFHPYETKLMDEWNQWGYKTPEEAYQAWSAFAWMGRKENECE